MTLKPESTRVADLRQAETEVLGFTVKAEKVNYDQERLADADPTKVSYGQERLADGDQTKVSNADPIKVGYADQDKVSYADQTDVSYADSIKVDYDLKRVADADPAAVSCVADPMNVSYDQERVAYTDPTKVSYADLNKANPVDQKKVSYNQEWETYADPAEVSYEADPTKVSYDQERLAHNDPAKVNYGADPIEVNYADSIKVNYDPVKVSYGISKQAWENLVKTLSTAHHSPDPRKTASAILRGWINGYGPIFESETEQSIVDWIRGLAAHRGFREVSPVDLEQHIQSARAQWRSFKGRFRDKGGCGILPLMDVAAPPAPDPAGASCC